MKIKKTKESTKGTTEGMKAEEMKGKVWRNNNLAEKEDSKEVK